MQYALRILIVCLISSLLLGCTHREELPNTVSQVLNDESNDPNDTAFLADGLIAPNAPSLSIKATPSALHFTWVDQRETPLPATTQITLYQYDYQTKSEHVISDDIAPGSTEYRHTVKTHTLAWQSISYRIEICDATDCVSSLRTPIRNLLGDAVSTLPPEDYDFTSSFGDQIVLNETGNVAVVTSPLQSCVLVYFWVDDNWVLASMLTSNLFTEQIGSTMQIAVSASGDTIAVGTIANTVAPRIVIFDRLGENWIETGVITPTPLLSMTQTWDTNSFKIDIDSDGDHIALMAQQMVPLTGSAPQSNNQVSVYQRDNIDWTSTALLPIPNGHTQLPALASSLTMDRVFALSTHSGNLYLHEYSSNNGSWINRESFIANVRPSRDNAIVSSHDGTSIVIAAWEVDSNNLKSTVAWKLAKIADNWIPNDSIKLPPTADSTATLRLASDAALDSLVVGWNGAANANIAFYAKSEQLWQNLFSLPSAFNLNRNVAYAQSIAISADNSTVMVGTHTENNSGLVTVFK